ncbi:MAG: hypothetical protein P4L46_19235 [Fimbriimonas sp.]|nr:hypothetical protein [Fimbriimonas sp.]
MAQAQLDFWKDLAIIFGGVLAMTTFLSGMLEFIRQGRQHRATHFVEMRRRFLEDPLFRDILNLLASNPVGLPDTPIQDRRNFVGFLEEVAVMVNSGLIKQEVAHYMFGYYVLLTDRCEPFWEGLDRGSQYWSVFRRFAKDMDALSRAEPSSQPVLRF